MKSLDSTLKLSLRKEFLAKRAEFIARSQSELAKFNLAIAHNCQKILPTEDSGPIATYFPKSDEADPNLIQRVLSHREFAYPVMEGSRLSFWVPRDSKAWRVAAFGIREPDPARSKKIELDEMSAFLVPGVVFDRRGARVGYGKGFYDRTLGDSSIVRIGIGYSVQLSSHPLPEEKGDVRMDWIVTETAAIARSTLIANESDFIEGDEKMGNDES